MSHDQFTNIALLSIERDLTNTIDCDTVLKYFLNNNKNRRINLNL